MPRELTRPLLLAAMLAIPATAFPAGVEFSKLAVPGPVGAMAVTEDGRTLVASHTTVHRVTVWDVATAKQIKSIECTSPGAVLCRGGRVYVANRGKATITVFSPAKDWEPVDELESGILGPVHLSAPAGQHFSGRLLVSSLETVDGRGDVRRVYVAEDKNERLYGDKGVAVAFCECAGRRGFLLSFSSGRLFRVRPNARQKSKLPILFQAREGPYWFGGNRVHEGFPPVTLDRAYGILAVADRKRDVFYALDSSSIRCVALDQGLSAGATRPATYPADFRRFYPRPGAADQEELYRKTDFLHVALTLGPDLHLYLYDAATRSVYHAKTAAFEAPRPGVATATRPPESPKDDRPHRGLPNVTHRRFPKQILVGQTITHALLDLEREGSYTLKTKQKGVKISSTGVITWTPTKRDLGVQTLRFWVTVRGQSWFVWRTTKVVTKLDPKLEPPAGPDLTSPLPPGLVRFVDKDFFAAPGLGGRSVLVLADGRLRLLDPSGASVRETFDPPQRYTAIFEREAYYVALTEASVDLLDKTTLAVKKSIPLKASEPHSLVLHPARPLCYVAANDPSKKGLLYASKPVLAVNETTGGVKVLPDVWGSTLAVDPTGHYLFAAVRDFGRRVTELDGPRPKDVVYPEYLMDVLLCYDIRGAAPRRLAYNPSPGVNAQGVVVSPDGRLVAYVGAGWSARFKYAVRTFEADNVAKDAVCYTAEAYPRELTFHPMVGLVALTNGQKVWIFDQKTGKQLSDRLAPDKVLQGASHPMFTPDGNRLLIAYQHPKYGPVLESLALRLMPEERTVVARGFHPPALVAAVAEKPEVRPGAAIPLDQLEALRAAQPAKLAPKEISRRWSSAVVMIDHPGGFGSGFVVGSKGYVLTCAHVLPKDGDPVVTYRLGAGGQTGAVRARAAVLRADRARDLALLQIRPEAPLPTVQLRTRGGLESGEEVTVIGNPGLGEAVLRDTLTAGVVSHPRRVLDAMPYVQTSAAVNPGNSGGPMFDGGGQVIGVVVLKARIEATAFAVPVETILDFLKAGRAAEKK